jgi:PAS domain S-box-containing protein
MSDVPLAAGEVAYEEKGVGRGGLWKLEGWRRQLARVGRALDAGPILPARRFHVWLIVGMLVLGIILHYGDELPLLSEAADRSPVDLATRQSVERILFLLPIIYATLAFGSRVGMITLVVAAAILLPRAVTTSGAIHRPIPETVGVIVVGLLLMLTIVGQRREMETIRRNRKRLAAVSEVSSALCHFTGLSQCLDTMVTAAKDVMGAEGAALYLVENGSDEVVLAGAAGHSVRPPDSLTMLTTSDTPSGAAADPAAASFQGAPVSRPLIRRTKTESGETLTQFVVPLEFNRGTIGVLVVDTTRHRPHAGDDIELIATIGRQAAVAIKSWRLHQEERRMSERLRISEERYREIFDNAHDAIWVQDMSGVITMANQACAEITGYSSDQLIGMKVSDFLSGEALEKAREVRRRLLAGQMIDGPYEQEITKPDGTPARLWLTTTLITSHGQPKAFQLIARDITEQTRLQQNLQSYLQHFTRTQEHERQRIARELHDETAQSLLLLAQRLDRLSSSPRLTIAPHPTEEIQSLRQEVLQTLANLRRLTQDLRPQILDDLGLVAALEWLADDLPHQFGVEVANDLDEDLPELADEAQLLLFRIAQEALRNVGRHSGAASATLSLKSSGDKVILTVTDDGKGFEMPKDISDLARLGKLGLLGMYERARLLCGTFEIRSSPGEGTTVVAELPALDGLTARARAGSL